MRDYTSGFVAARRSVFDKIRLQGDYGEYCIDLLGRAQRLRLRVDEVPYICGSRLHGESKTGADVGDYLRKGWKYVVTVLRLAFWALSAFAPDLSVATGRGDRGPARTFTAGRVAAGTYPIEVGLYNPRAEGKRLNVLDGRGQAARPQGRNREVRVRH